jgi:hypothetical protein
MPIYLKPSHIARRNMSWIVVTEDGIEIPAADASKLRDLTRQFNIAEIRAAGATPRSSGGASSGSSSGSSSASAGDKWVEFRPHTGFVKRVYKVIGGWPALEALCPHVRNFKPQVLGGMADIGIGKPEAEKIVAAFKSKGLIQGNRYLKGDAAAARALRVMKETVTITCATSNPYGGDLTRGRVSRYGGRKRRR